MLHDIATYLKGEVSCIGSVIVAISGWWSISSAALSTDSTNLAASASVSKAKNRMIVSPFRARLHPLEPTDLVDLRAGMCALSSGDSCVVRVSGRVFADTKTFLRMRPSKPSYSTKGEEGFVSRKFGLWLGLAASFTASDGVGEEGFELSLLDGLSVARCRQDFVGGGFTQHRSTVGRAVGRPTDTRCRADQRRNNILCEQGEHAGNDQLPFRTSRFGRAKPCQIALQFHLGAHTLGAFSNTTIGCEGTPSGFGNTEHIHDNEAHSAGRVRGSSDL